MYRVVVVDDEPYMLEGMRLMIDWAKCGFELCGTADSAQEALRLVQVLKPHLLITDVRMPGMLGTDLAAILRRYHPDTALMFFSGYTDFSYAQTAIRFDASGFLLKPIDPDEVHAALMKVKAKLDEKREREPEERERMKIVRDHVLRRIAGGDMSDDNMLRAGLLMGIKPDDMCVCAVLDSLSEPLPDSASYLLSATGASLFSLSPSLYGLCLKQYERDLAPLDMLSGRLYELFGLRTELCVGDVGMGIKGFAESLTQAIEAQGVQFEQIGSLRVYKPYDAGISEWLVASDCAALPPLLLGGDMQALQKWLDNMQGKAVMASMFQLRAMALAIETNMAISASRQSASMGYPLRTLWREETLDKQVWLGKLSDKLLEAADKLKSGGDGQYPEAVGAALTAIGSRYMLPLNIGDVAGELNMSSAYLGQLIRKHTGQTFHKLLLSRRVSQASKALRRTSEPVGVIAAKVGFQDVDYFSRQFRAVMGMSPNAYRRGDGEESQAVEIQDR